MLSIDERKEIIVHSSSKKQMFALRKAITSKFKNIWILLYNDPDRKIYGIEVNSAWGSKLSKEREKEIKSFVNGWMKENLKS
jgi:hypothetical protein